MSLGGRKLGEESGASRQLGTAISDVGFELLSLQDCNIIWGKKINCIP